MDPVLTLAAAMAYGRPLFYAPTDRRAEAEAAKRSLLGTGTAYNSDHLAIIAAFNAWSLALRQGGRSEASAVGSP